jgi:DNA topoisomerase-1
LAKENLSSQKKDETRYTAEEAAAFTLEQVKEFIEAQIPGAFAKKTKVAVKKTATKKAPAKKKAVKKKAAKKK